MRRSHRRGVLQPLRGRSAGLHGPLVRWRHHVLHRRRLQCLRHLEVRRCRHLLGHRHRQPGLLRHHLHRHGDRVVGRLGHLQRAVVRQPQHQRCRRLHHLHLRVEHGRRLLQLPHAWRQQPEWPRAGHLRPHRHRPERLLALRVLHYKLWYHEPRHGGRDRLHVRAPHVVVDRLPGRLHWRRRARAHGDRQEGHSLLRRSQHHHLGGVWRLHV
mmetsp:Transcript_78767/g.109416  ORF Transcript_78767/g.109416 Transcript_78767/m.109416 type:complete len:213 (+) Transcript_78767:1071-1709(+)